MIVGIRYHACLGSGRENACTQGLCEYQIIAGLCAYILKNFIRMHISSNAETVFGFLVLDRMTACDGTACFHGLVMSAHKNLTYGLFGKAVGNAEQVHGHFGLSAHGIHIA